MFAPQDLSRLMAAMRRHGVTRLALEEAGAVLELGLAPGPAPALAPAAEPAPVPQRQPALSPAIGHFLPRGQDDGLAPLAAGDGVGAGETLGYVTLGAFRVPVTSPAAGRIARLHATAGQVTGHGDTLFEIEDAR